MAATGGGEERNESLPLPLSFDRMKSSFLDKISSAKEKISSTIDDVLKDNKDDSSSSSSNDGSNAGNSSSSSSFPSFDFESMSLSSSSPDRKQSNNSATPAAESVSEKKIRFKTLFAELNNNPLLQVYINELTNSFYDIQQANNDSGTKSSSSIAAKLDDAFSLLSSSVPTVTNKSSLYISREVFVQDAIRRSFSPSWADAAFMTFCTHTSLVGIVLHEYILALFTLNTKLITRDLVDLELNYGSSDKSESGEKVRKIWLDLRRSLVFNHYDRSRSGKLQLDDFIDFMEDMSLEDGAPEGFGLEGKVWTFKPESSNKNSKPKFNNNSSRDNYSGGGDSFNRNRSQSDIARDVDLDSLIHMLANNRILFAQKQLDYDELNLSYKQLERQVCDLKLTVAELKSQVASEREPSVDNIISDGIN